MEARPISREVANAFINANHSHHKAPQGDKFRVGAFDGDELVAVAVGARPQSRHMDDGFTIEIVRSCTRGFRNAASFCEGRILKAAAAVGYRLAITYTLEHEAGTSLKAQGFRKTALGKGGSWGRPDDRPREDKAPTGPKWRWERELGAQTLPPSSSIEGGKRDE